MNLWASLSWMGVVILIFKKYIPIWSGLSISLILYSTLSVTGTRIIYCSVLGRELYTEVVKASLNRNLNQRLSYKKHNINTNMELKKLFTEYFVKGFSIPNHHYSAFPFPSSYPGTCGNVGW